MNLNLKKARSEDVDLLFEWANDRGVRENSFNTAPIAYEEHVKWFGKILADESVHQYILYEDDIPAGQVRLNIEGKNARISFSVAEKNRGRGLGSAMLMMLPELLVKDKITGVTKLVGEVKHENAASARAFEKCGYARHERERCLEFELEVKQ